MAIQKTTRSHTNDSEQLVELEKMIHLTRHTE